MFGEDSYKIVERRVLLLAITMDNHGSIAMMSETIDMVFTQQARINLFLHKFAGQKRHPLALMRHLNNHVKVINYYKTLEI